LKTEKEGLRGRLRQLKLYYAIYLNVTDANGEIAQSETAYVSVAQPQGTVLGDSWMLILVLIAVVAVVAVIALVLVTRRAPHPASSV
jgi:hypothetical protein